MGAGPCPRGGCVSPWPEQVPVETGAAACYNCSMSQLQLLRIRIKPGMTEDVVRYIQGLGRRNAEVTAAFVSQGMQTQSFFLERRSDGDWLYYLARAEDLLRAALVHEQSDDALATEGRELVEKAWADIHAPELLCDLEMQPSGQVVDALPDMLEFALKPIDADRQRS